MPKAKRCEPTATREVVVSTLPAEVVVRLPAGGKLAARFPRFVKTG